MRALGFAIFRVRHHGELARIELSPADMSRALERRIELLAAVKRAGYRFVALDLAGFRSGSLNVLLDPPAVTAARPTDLPAGLPAAPSAERPKEFS